MSLRVERHLDLNARARARRMVNLQSAARDVLSRVRRITHIRVISQIGREPALRFRQA